MKNYDLLTKLKMDIKEASNVQVNYIISDEKIIDGSIMTVFSKNSIDINSEIDLKSNNILDLDNLESLGIYVDSHVCSAYTKTKEECESIEGYVDFTIVICKLSSTVYKIDSTMERIDKDTNLCLETNTQCTITLISK